MSEQIETWGDLVERAGVGIGETPSDAPVTKLISAPVSITGLDGTRTLGVADPLAAACRKRRAEPQ